MLPLQSPPALVAQLPRQELLAEDLAFDPATGRWFVSSVHRRRILTRAPGRPWRTFAEGPCGLLALGLDAPRRRLWAAWAGLPQVEGLTAAEAGRTGLVAFDLDSGREVARIALEGEGHVLGDLTVGPDGTIYAADNRGGGLYLLRPGASTLEALAPPRTFRSPQTPALLEGIGLEGALLVPDYSRGLALLPLAGGPPRWLEAPPGVDLRGIDGLVVEGDRIYAVQNGAAPNRILRLRLGPDRAVASVEVLLRLPEATHLLLRAGRLWILADNGWDRYTPQGALRPDRPPEPAPRILALRLP